MESGPIRPGMTHFMITDSYGPGDAPFSFKLPWFVRNYHDLKVEVYRLDAPGIGRVWLDGAPTFPGERAGEWGIAGDVQVPTAGCWRVTGTNPDGSASFVFKVPRGS